jgi:hypothetical protein
VLFLQQAIIPKNEAHRDAAAVGGRREADEGGTGGLVISNTWRRLPPKLALSFISAAARLVLQRYMYMLQVHAVISEAASSNGSRYMPPRYESRTLTDQSFSR